MSTPQEYWDVCLIKTWRQFGRYGDAVNMFLAITGIDLMRHHEARTILRTPKKFFPYGTGVRVFASEYLPKINDWLLDHPPEKDVLLLRKLSKSKYDTEDKAYQTEMQTSTKSEYHQLQRNRLKVGMSDIEKSNRNQSTDWNVVKGPVRIKRRR